jgi:hypothetical protein
MSGYDDGNRGVRPARSLVFPLVLIIVGGLFLYANWRPEFDPWRILAIYWPLILIFLGLGRIWDNTRQGGSTQRYSSGLTVGVLAFVMVIGVLLWHGQSFSRGLEASSAMQHTTRTVEAGGVKDVRATVEMPAGELTVSGGSASLLDASFDQRQNAGEPQVEYDHSGASGVLKISEGGGEHTNIVIPGHDNRNWSLRFGDSVPLDLKIDMGAGQGNLRLRGVPLTKLELNIGAGRVDADLTGDRKEDLTADIEGGVGEADIRLPKNVGVIVQASGGIGSLDTDGLEREGGSYVNAAYGKSPATIHLKVEGGIGHIILRLEP